MAMKLKQGVTVSKDGTINIGAGVKGVSDKTKSAVTTRNTNIASGNAYANTVIGQSMKAVTGGSGGSTAASTTREGKYQNYLNTSAAQGSAGSIGGQPTSGLPSDTNLESTIVGSDIAPVPGSADSIIEGESDYERMVREQYNESQKPIDEEAIRKEKEAQYQGQLDSINKLYADKLNQARIQGQGRLGSSTAMQARGGLLGSDFGAAQTNNTIAYNTSQENTVEMEKQVKLNEIFSVVQQLATSEIAAKKLAKEAGSTAYMAFLKDEPARKEAKTGKLAALILMKDMKTKDVSDAALKTAGISRQDLELAYYQAKQAQDSATAEAETKAETNRLSNEKTEAEIAKINYEASKNYEEGGIIYNKEGVKIGVKQGENYEAGGNIYEAGTNKFIGVAKKPGDTNSSSSNAPAPSRTPTISSEMTQDGTFKVNIANGAAPRKSDRGYYECGMLVNDTLGTSMGDAFDDKMRYNNSSTPVVGGAFIQEYGETGHTGVIESINADGTLNIVETNYPLGSGVSRKTINPNSRGITGYYNPKTAGSTGGISRQAQAVIDQINSQGGKPQDYILGTNADSQALLNEVLRGMNAQGGSGTLASETKKQSLSLAMSTITDLLGMKDLAGSVQTRKVGESGPIDSLFNLTANENVNFVNRVDALAGQLLQIDGPTLKAMFGPQISNSDVEAIKRTILQGLDPKNQNPAAFERSLSDVKAKMQAYLSRLPQGTNTQTNTTAPTGGGTNNNPAGI